MSFRKKQIAPGRTPRLVVASHHRRQVPTKAVGHTHQHLRLQATPAPSSAQQPPVAARKLVGSKRACLAHPVTRPCAAGTSVSMRRLLAECTRRSTRPSLTTFPPQVVPVIQMTPNEKVSVTLLLTHASEVTAVAVAGGGICSKTVRRTNLGGGDDFLWEVWNLLQRSRGRR